MNFRNKEIIMEVNSSIITQIRKKVKCLHEFEKSLSEIVMRQLKCGTKAQELKHKAKGTCELGGCE